MNDDQVPEFDDDYSIPVSSSAHRGKSTMSEDDIMELVWHDGQLVTQRQSQKRPTKYDVVSMMPEDITAPAPENQPQLFMHEDEMASWLHYPLNDDNVFCSDLLYTDVNTAVKSPTPPAYRPPVHPFLAKKPESGAQNFLLFSRLNNNNNTTSSSRFETAAPTKSVVRETATVVDSSDTPLVGPNSRAVDFRRDNHNDNSSPGISGDVGGGRGGGGGMATPTSATAAGSAGKDGTCEISLTSSPGGGSTSGGSGSLRAELISTQKPPLLPPPVDRKRKGRETGDAAECQSEDVVFESGNAKKQKQGSSSTRRSRAAEVHNLSERRRRDRINEKMRVLQEMIPRCNKSDKASMLEEAIEYMKSLKMQLQMVSMGCGMVPMMFPGVPPYMPMGMARMGMDMSRHMMPYGYVLPGSPMPPAAAAAAHLAPRFPMPAYQMQTMHPEDPNRVQATSQSENMSHMPHAESQNQPQGPTFAEPYQQYFTPQQMQMQMQMLQQHQAMAQQSSKPSSSTAPENQDSPQ